MPRVVPEDYPRNLLANDAERRVFDALFDGLHSEWIMIPNLGMDGFPREFETDFVLLHPDFGVMLVETKGMRLSIHDGIWMGEQGTALDPQPVKQAKDNAYELRRRLRRLGLGLERLDVQWAIAFPNVRAMDGELPLDFHPERLLLAPQLADPERALQDLVYGKGSVNRALSREQIEAIVGLLRPDAEFVWDIQEAVRQTRQRLDELCAAQIDSMATLSVNRRVVVRGRAGTGKTRLAVAWAQKAWREGDRVWLTCFNDPLAESLRTELGSFDDGELLVGSFLQSAFTLPGMPELEIPPTADRIWWETVAVGHLVSHWPLVGAPFDTIIVDEAQDFSPAWIGLLEALLDPSGRRRMHLLVDEEQELFERGFVVPAAEDGWVHAELTRNFRNAERIGRILRRTLGGAPSPAHVPMGIGVRWFCIDDGDVETASELVDVELDRIREEEQRSTTGIGVITFRSAVRDHLRTAHGLVAWEERDEESVLCENVHRLKGLEFDSAIVVAPTEVDDDSLLYVAVSRAVAELVMIAPRSIGERLGLEPYGQT